MHNVTASQWLCSKGALQQHFKHCHCWFFGKRDPRDPALLIYHFLYYQTPFFVVLFSFEGWKFAPRQMDQLISIPSQWMWRRQSSTITGWCTIWRWGPAVWVRAELVGFICFIIPSGMRLAQGAEGTWTAFVLGPSCPGPFLVHTIRLFPL